ncbi:hypothetical protein [Hymenobacter terricola]|uniref:hypothetical protein n=1 Tax=Hymenobacter terricola TaxID=2819236 RepID=UPI001B311D59|nr:hypothetical protein [Hymenobacter terricola]
MDIVTSLCVDDEQHPASRYAQLLDVKADQRRRIYWQCAVVFFATSLRCNPTNRHLFYTNDAGPAVWHEVDYRAFLQGLGVEIRVLPFTDFQPPAGFSTDFRNAFYKLEVLQALARAEAGDSSVLLDSDCVWTRPAPALHPQIAAGPGLLLLNVLIETTPDTKIEGLSRRDMGELYQEIYPDYPPAVPTFFGGEIVGGRRTELARLVAELRATWQHLLRAYPTAPPRFCTQESIYDNDEYVMNLVLNYHPRPWIDASPHIRRIWTSHRFTNVQPTDAQLPIWHLPSEKLQGLPTLCRRALAPHSQFWQVPLTGFGAYLGKYLGVTAPTWAPQRLLALANKLPRVLVLAKRLLAH